MPGDGNDFGWEQQLALLQGNPQYLDAAMRGNFGSRGVDSPVYIDNPTVSPGPGGGPGNIPGSISAPMLAAQMNTQRQIDPLQKKIEALAAQIAQGQKPAEPPPPNLNTTVPQPFKPRPSPWDPSKFSTGPSTGLPPLIGMKSF